MNRIDYIPHIDWVQMLVCEITNITMNCRSAIVWAHQPHLPWSHGKRSLRMKWRPTKLQRRLRSKWKVRRSLIQMIPVQDWVLFSTQWTMDFNMRVLMRVSGFWMLFRFTNWSRIEFLVRKIFLRACLEPRFWRTWFWQYGSFWVDRFRIPIWQELWWQMKWALEGC